MMRLERDPESVASSLGGYLALLSRLQRAHVFGAVTIYPAIGVDGLPALYAEKIVGVNLASHSAEAISSQLAAILPQDLQVSLRTALNSKVVYESGVDVSGFSLIKRVLAPYEKVSPKAVIVKGLFASVFLREWDPDTERYYAVDSSSATSRANAWLDALVQWLSSDDTIVVSDRELFPFLSTSTSLKEIDAGLDDPGESSDVAFATTVPVVLLTRYARVFTRL